jgi:hypothetical protein
MKRVTVALNVLQAVKWQEDEEEEVGSYWMTLKKGEDTLIWRRTL